MAIKHSRGAAKEIAKAAGESTWAFSTGRIHSFKTRTTYQQHVVRFVRWARSTHHIKILAQLDPQAVALTTEWLQLQLVECKSPYTLQAERAALRLFFANRTLASGVAIPRRARESIRRSRGPAAHDRHINLAHWQPLIRFLQATGLRRNELRALRTRDISRDAPNYPGRGRCQRCRAVRLMCWPPLLAATIRRRWCSRGFRSTWTSIAIVASMRRHFISIMHQAEIYRRQQDGSNGLSMTATPRSG